MISDTDFTDFYAKEFNDSEEALKQAMGSDYWNTVIEVQDRIFIVPEKVAQTFEDMKCPFYRHRFVAILENINGCEPKESPVDKEHVYGLNPTPTYRCIEDAIVDEMNTVHHRWNHFDRKVIELDDLVSIMLRIAARVDPKSVSDWR